ncbi:MAG TPA: hypothetical protein VGS19_26985 [Streptosporangiaceae bacterium]|nr:hypothetical protein [Streptosporangiaceae bacterium]
MRPWHPDARDYKALTAQRQRYDRARTSLDRHATYILAAYVAAAAR